MAEAKQVKVPFSALELTEEVDYTFDEEEYFCFIPLWSLPAERVDSYDDVDPLERVNLVVGDLVTEVCVTLFGTDYTDPKDLPTNLKITLVNWLYGHPTRSSLDEDLKEKN